MSKSPQVAAEEAQASAMPHLIAPELVEVGADGPRLVGGRCGKCGALSFPKAHVCPECLSLEIATAPVASEGVLYSFSVVHQAPKGWDVPYALGYVDLPDGLRVLSHIGGDLAKIRIDQKLRLGIARVGSDAQGAMLTSYVFTPVSGAAS